ncbi:helix-turn-helix domain-containing protein [Terribacillus saccharophilus]|nr:LuxR C-terminal-related transcriptional regulator [Terribacillus saccharophilus]
MKDNDYRPKQLLTKREKEVFELLVQDKTTKEIAQELFISEKTVRNHISNVVYTFYRKCDTCPLYVYKKSRKSEARHL